MRRELQCTKQLEGEDIETFADRVYALTLKGYPEAGECTVQSLAVDFFIQGCKDKTAAWNAVERSPTTLPEAVQYVKTATTNAKLLGVRVSSYTARQVTFDVGPDGSPLENELQEATTEMTKNVRNLSEVTRGVLTMPDTISHTIRNVIHSELQEFRRDHEETRKTDIGTNNNRSRSPSPNRGCFSCEEPGHF